MRWIRRFANYVVQTALDYAEPAQRAQLIETIRPILRAFPFAFVVA